MIDCLTQKGIFEIQFKLYAISTFCQVIWHKNEILHLQTNLFNSCLLAMTKINLSSFSEAQIDRIIEMAWEDRTPFDAILAQFGLTEAQVIALMRNELKPASWRLWRERAHQISHKHAAMNPDK